MVVNDPIELISPSRFYRHEVLKQVLKRCRWIGVVVVVFVSVTFTDDLFATDFPGDFTANVTPQVRYFFHSGNAPSAWHADSSIAIESEYYLDWDDRKQALTITLFGRLDQRDDQRTHADIRELNWLYIDNNWEWRIGIGRVFWGVTESQHLVDIINQTDAVENIDEEDKLGQPMIQATWLKDWGAVQFFLLPYFRERTFPENGGRLGADPVVDTEGAEFESSREDKHIDWAVRANGTMGQIDFGLSQFVGTSRDPELVLQLADNGAPRLIPRYNQIKQTGLELQAIIGDWLWKLEAIYQFNPVADYFASVGGFEYTFVGVFKSPIDVGMLGEFHFDDRMEAAPNPLQKDLFIGARLTFNDVQSSEVLAGGFFDLNNQGRSFRLEASRRFGKRWKLSLEFQTFSNISSKDPLFALRNDDFLQIDWGYFF